MFGQHKRCLFIRRYSRTRQISIGILKNIRSAWYNICSVPQRALRGCNTDGSMINIDGTAAGNEAADNMYGRSELDCPICSAAPAHAAPVSNGSAKEYPAALTGHMTLDF